MSEKNAAIIKETQSIDTRLNGVFNVADLFQSSTLDQDKNGKIKRTEVNAAIPSTEFTGDNAVALATVRERFKDLRGLDTTDGERRDITAGDLRKLASLGNLKAMKMIAEGKTIFSTLDTNGDAKLDKGELQQAISSVNDGASKRALQAMLNDFEIIGGKDAKSISAKQIKEYVAKRMNVQQESSLDSIANTFAQRKERLDGSNRQPFAERVPFWSVNGDAPTQGIVGDCWLVAATSSLCEKNPWAVDQMMKDNQDGTITVKFPYVHDGKNLEATIAKPTDAELALYATTGKHGTYGAILEKALGAIMEANPDLKGQLTGVERDRGKGVPVQELLNGSRKPFAIELLTGEKARTVDLTTLTPDQLHNILSASWNSVATCDSDGKWPKPVEQAVERLADKPKGGGVGSDSPERRPKKDPDEERPNFDEILIGPGPKPDVPKPKPRPWENVDEDEDGVAKEKSPSAHEFAILNYDENRRVVTIRNPWGSGELVDQNGKPRDGKNDGKMELTLEEFTQYFKRISMPERVIDRGLARELPDRK